MVPSKPDRYHFEELSSPTIGSFGCNGFCFYMFLLLPSVRQYSIWEVPGNDVMRPLWPMFYRHG